MKSSKILTTVNQYYTDKVRANGATPQGVDWNSKESQFLRFSILSGVIREQDGFSLIDYGCGFGSMLEYLDANFSGYKYYGFDISEEMIRQGMQLHPGRPDASWYSNYEEVPAADYVIASGIFNVRLDTSDEDWLKYILDTLHAIDKKAKKGFAFNMLTSYSDREYMKDYLYYADPLFIFDYCKKNFSRYVTLQHDYPLYEFSILIQK